MAYEPFLLGVGVVFNLLTVLSKIWELGPSVKGSLWPVSPKTLKELTGLTLLEGFEKKTNTKAHKKLSYHSFRNNYILKSKTTRSCNCYCRKCLKIPEDTYFL